MNSDILIEATTFLEQSGMIHELLVTKIRSRLKHKAVRLKLNLSATDIAFFNL